MTNKMQLCRIIYCSLTALHVSGDIFAHHQEHYNCIYSFWYYSRMWLPAGVMDELELSVPNHSWLQTHDSFILQSNRKIVLWCLCKDVNCLLYRPTNAQYIKSDVCIVKCSSVFRCIYIILRESLIQYMQKLQNQQKLVQETPHIGILPTRHLQILPIVYTATNF
jgi:hypothetical protein